MFLYRIIMEKLKTLYGIVFDVEYYKDKDYIDIILDIFNNDNLNYDLNDKNILNIIGSYYQYKIKNYDEMKKYYLMSIKLNNDRSMFNLGNYYQYIEKNYIEMKKYYLMSIELNDATSMYHLAYYYRHIEKNYDKMKKYYLMAIELNNVHAMSKLCYFHKYLQHYLLRQINSKIAIKKVRELEKNNFLGVKIFKELTEYCFNPQRLLKLCNIYNVELNDYMDII